MKPGDAPLSYTFVPSPIGDLLIAGIDDSLHVLSFPSGSRAWRPSDRWQRDDQALPDVRAQLAGYFAGEIKRFGLDLAPWGTPFQLAVWDALRAIPHGETTTYAAIAQRIGRPTATRAVGAANGANPIPIIIPCHRVIGASGALTGFGGGLPVKQALLALERPDPLLL